MLRRAIRLDARIGAADLLRRRNRCMLLRTESRVRTLCISICLVCAAAGSFAQGRGSLKAGVARVEITPAPDAALPMSGYAGRGPHEGIHDSIYVRALVLDDGTRKAAIIACELIGIPETLWTATIRRLTGRTPGTGSSYSRSRTTTAS